MENKDQENKAAKDPQPSDQVQLEIETVTPDTEKNVVPTTNSDQSVNDTTNIDEQKGLNSYDDKSTQDDTVITNETDHSSEKEEQSDDVKDKPTEIEAVVPDKAKAETSTNNSEDETSTTKKDDSENDERDKIETVSP